LLASAQSGAAEALEQALLVEENGGTPPRQGILVAPAPGPGETAPRQMKSTEDIRKYAAERGIAEEEALKKGMEEKSKEFVEKGAEVYAKA
jgi:hypothetical protein